MGSTIGKAVSTSLAHTYSMIKTPKYEGEHVVKGINNDVKVIFDKHGTCHIYAKSKEDVIFTQGYYTGQERLFVLDMLRRFAKGTISEIVKTDKGEEYPASLGLDKLIRTIGFLRCAEREVSMIPEDDRRCINAFLRGINTYLKSPDYIRPVEMFLGNISGSMDGDPDPFTFLDFVAISRFTSWTFGKGLLVKILNTCIKDEFGVRISDFFSMEHFSNDYFRFMTDQKGSNGIAVSGKYTESGYPILEGDPHLPPGNPSFWLRFHLVVEENPLRPLEKGIDANGLTVVGGFGIQCGHNGVCSFTPTLSFVDHVDLYLEKKLEDDDDDFLLPVEEEGRGGGRQDFFLDCDGYYVPCEEVREEIFMLGHENPYIHTVQITQNGPIISHVVNPHTNEFKEEKNNQKKKKKKKKNDNNSIRRRRSIEIRNDIKIDGVIRKNVKCVKEDPDLFQDFLRNRVHSGIISMRSSILQDPEEDQEGRKCSTNQSICSKLFLVQNVHEFINIMRESHYINAAYTFADNNPSVVVNDNSSSSSSHFDEHSSSPGGIGNIAWVCCGKVPKRQTEDGAGSALLGYDKKQQWLGFEEKQPVIVNPKQGYIIGCNNDVYESFGIKKPYFMSRYFLPPYRSDRIERGLGDLIGQGKKIGMGDLRKFVFDTTHPKVEIVLKILDCFVKNKNQEEEEEVEGEEESEREEGQTGEENDDNNILPLLKFVSSKLREFDGNFRKDSYLPSLYVAFVYGYISTYWTHKRGLKKEKNEEEDPFEGQLFLHMMGNGIPVIDSINEYVCFIDILVIKIHESLLSLGEKREMVRLAITEGLKYLEERTNKKILGQRYYIKDVESFFKKHFRYGNIHRLVWKHNLHDHVYGFDIGGFEVGGWYGTPYQTPTNFKFVVDSHPSCRLVVDLSDPFNKATCMIYPGNSAHAYSPFYQLGAKIEEKRQKVDDDDDKNERVEDFKMWCRREVVQSNSYGVVLFKKKRFI